jgi:hypothetical protein
MKITLGITLFVLFSIAFSQQTCEGYKSVLAQKIDEAAYEVHFEDSNR